MDPLAGCPSLSWVVPRHASRPHGRLVQTYPLLRETTDQNIGRKRQIELRYMIDMTIFGGTS